MDSHVTLTLTQTHTHSDLNSFSVAESLGADWSDADSGYITSWLRLFGSIDATSEGRGGGGAMGGANTIVAEVDLLQVWQILL